MPGKGTLWDAIDDARARWRELPTRTKPLYAPARLGEPGNNTPLELWYWHPKNTPFAHLPHALAVLQAAVALETAGTPVRLCPSAEGRLSGLFAVHGMPLLVDPAAGAVLGSRNVAGHVTRLFETLREREITSLCEGNEQTAADAAALQMLAEARLGAAVRFAAASAAAAHSDAFYQALPWGARQLQRCGDTLRTFGALARSLLEPAGDPAGDNRLRARLSSYDATATAAPPAISGPPPPALLADVELAVRVLAETLGSKRYLLADSVSRSALGQCGGGRLSVDAAVFPYIHLLLSCPSGSPFRQLILQHENLLGWSKRLWNDYAGILESLA